MDATSLAQLWSDIEPAVEQAARFPPRGLEPSTWATVATGNVARLRVEPGAAGVGLLACTRAEAWLAVTDDHPVDAVEGLFQLALSGAWAQEKWLYQLLDLPWPLQDRHWVLHSTNNLGLARSTGAWERVWENAPERLPEARARLVGAAGSVGSGGTVDAARWDEAIAVPVNRGSWLLVEAGPDATLAFYRAEADLGGGVPPAAAEAYTASTLDSYFRATLKDALSMRSRYGTGCAPQPGGDGALIPCFPGAR